MKFDPTGGYLFTPHALVEMKRRGISEEVVRSILASPEQTHEVRPGRIVLQSRAPADQALGRQLIRVFVDVDRQPAEVVTVYRTSKVEKYWR